MIYFMRVKVGARTPNRNRGPNSGLIRDKPRTPQQQKSEDEFNERWRQSYQGKDSK